MASFLSFVYRRQSAPASLPSSSSSAVASPDRHQTRLSLGKSHDQAPRQYLPPGVTSSGSSDTAWAPHLSHDSSEEGDDEERMYLSSPFTPEGLLPRKSADSLRRELKLSPRVLDHCSDKELAGVAKILAGPMLDPASGVTGNSRPSSRNPSVQPQYCDEDEDMILPPPDYLQSKPTFDSSVKSPVVSTSSFYSRGSSRPVAMSPVLQVGQARTAVGALVALREAAHSNRYDAEKTVPTTLLPPPSQSEKPLKQEAHQSFPKGVLPPLPTEGEKKEMDESEENVPYLPLVANVNTPVRRAISVDDDDDDISNDASPSSLQQFPTQEARAAVDTSFSSHAGLLMNSQAEEGYYDFQPLQSSPAPSRCSQSLISLGKVEEELSEDEAVAGGGASNEDASPHLYDCEEEELDQALMARKFRNQKLQKQRMMQKSDSFGEDRGFENDGFEEEEEDDNVRNGVPVDDSIDIYDEDEDKYAVQQGMISLDDVLLRRKMRNQRLEKEALLVEVVARLRDNLDLVSDIETAASSTVAAMGNWFVKTPIDAAGLMTGFSIEQRNSLLSSIDAILAELKVAPPEEFIVSPSKVPVLATRHDSLTQALCFSRALILSAIPLKEKTKMVMELPQDSHLSGSQRLFLWQCVPELYGALGLDSPQSPESVRGGGTSLFSLPEESGAETPHTSNVSLATSITSANLCSPKRRAPQPARPQLILQQDGLQLRQTVQVVSSLLQKLTLACLKLGGLTTKETKAAAQSYVRACEEIKQVYLQMITIQKEDTKALTGAFYLESISPHHPNNPSGTLVLAREVSADEDEDDTKFTAPVPFCAASILAITHKFPQQQLQAKKIKRRNCDNKDAVPRVKATADKQKTSSSSATLFSPSSEDMRSWATLPGDKDYDNTIVPFEYDDLRRQVGSYDREDNNDDEQRDGTCEDESRDDVADDDFRRRMYFNVSLAAHSIRTLGTDEQRE